VDRVTPAQLQEVANRIFDPNRLSELRFVPTETD